MVKSLRTERERYTLLRLYKTARNLEHNDQEQSFLVKNVTIEPIEYFWSSSGVV